MTSQTSRRSFLRTSLSMGAAMAVGGLGAKEATARMMRRAGGMRVLVLGGTQFVGPALVAELQKRGHKVTVFNRGRTEKRKGMLPGDVERLVGDRDPKVGEGIKALEGKKWDAVIDDCGYYPRMVKASAELLAPNVGHYVFVSSISAYRDNSKTNQDETAELARLDDPTVETMGEQFQNYGGLKVLCEEAAEAAMPGRVTVIRPGFIVGPGDPTDRFTYWPVRVSRGGEVMSPGTKDDPLQVIDVRDLAAFMVQVVEDKSFGTFNACGPESKLTFGEMLDSCKAAGGDGKSATFTWVSGTFLEQLNANLKEGDRPYDLPLWAPPTGESAGFHTWSSARAMKAGLKCRSIGEITRDTLAWWPEELNRRKRVTRELIDEAVAKGETPPQMDDPERMRAGITAEQEAAALKLWHEQAKG